MKNWQLHSSWQLNASLTISHEIKSDKVADVQMDKKKKSKNLIGNLSFENELTSRERIYAKQARVR